MKVLVTGGSGGIGAACVRAFRARGDEVVFLYHRNLDAAEALAAETGALCLQADVTDSAAVDSAVDSASRRLGGIDALVCCAGIAQIKLFTDLTDDDFRKMIDTNLSGAFYSARAAAKEMIRNQSGKIVFIGSMWGKVGASCEVHYSASKAALRGLTMALAKELGPSHITVNCVEPGVIQTPMNRSLDPDTIRQLIDQTPLCRIGSPDDVASAVTFLTSDSASFITGQILGVDGGFAV